jgi:hypothetical protein
LTFESFKYELAYEPTKGMKNRFNLIAIVATENDVKNYIIRPANSWAELARIMIYYFNNPEQANILVQQGIKRNLQTKEGTK